MSKIFTLKMLCDENDNFVRDYQIDGSWSLLQLHKLICADLEYDPMTMVSFFKSDLQWDKLQEYTLLDMEGGVDPQGNVPLPMGETTLESVVGNVRERLIYLFDMFGDRAMFLELMSVHEGDPDKLYPRVTESSGFAPHQFDPDETEDDSSIFDELMGDFDGYEEDEYEDEK